MLSVPPITRSPGRLATGIDSPVSIDSSTALVPDVISPSTGMRSPGLTITVSPRRTSPMGTSVSRPSRSDARGLRLEFHQRAEGGRRLTLRARFERAADEHERDDDDHRLVIHVRRQAAADEEIRERASPISENRKAAPVPSATSVFMSAEPCRTLAQARV